MNFCGISMGSKRRNGVHSRCKNCKINYRFCFCDHLKPCEGTTPIRILMHFRETHLPSNTAYFMSKVRSDCKIFKRGKPDESIDYQEITDQTDYQPLYLFPHDGADELSTELVRSFDKPIKLIVPDGSWRQARKFKRRISELKNVPCVGLPPGKKSSYVARNAPHEGMLSTYEAISTALGIIEGREVEEKLDEIFKVINERIYISRHGLRGDQSSPLTL